MRALILELLITSQKLLLGKAKSSRGDYTASEDDNTLVTGIAGDKEAIGYVPLAYYEENKA